MGQQWHEIIAVADKEMVTPALYCSLFDKGLLDEVPEEISQLLLRHFMVSTIKNEKIREQLEELIAILSDAGVDTIALKGGHYLLEPGTERLGARMMRDLDLVVHPGSLPQAVEEFRNIGYNIDDGDDEDGGTYGFVPLYRPGGVAPIDLHVFIGEQKRVLPPQLAWAQAMPIEAHQKGIYKLSPTHEVLHNIFHSEIQDRGHPLGFFRLRKLWDLARMCVAYGESVDWGEIRAITSQFRIWNVYEARLYQANKLLALPLPDGIRPTKKAKSHMQKCFRIEGSDFLTRMTLLWAGATIKLKKHHIDLVYDCGLDPFTIGAFRARHVFAMLYKHRGNIWQKILQNRAHHE